MSDSVEVADNCKKSTSVLEKLAYEDDLQSDNSNIRLISRTNYMKSVLEAPLCLILTSYSSEEQNLSRSFIGARGRYQFEKKIDRQAAVMTDTIPVMHSHNYTELIYVLDGAFEHCIEGRRSTYKKGQVCILNKNIHHSIRYRTSCTLVQLCISREYSRESFQYNLIHKTSPELFQFASVEETKIADYILQYMEFIPLSDSGCEYDEINTLIKMLDKELSKRTHGQTQMVRALVVRLFSNFVDYPERYAIHHHVLNTQSKEYLFNQITRCIEQSSGRPTRQYLEQQIGYCGDHINRIVKKHSGMSLRAYIRTVKVSKAERMLKYTDESISKIITSIGFENKTHFYQLFKEKNGETPREFRARFR
ncbi:AraC family transcriptional regulator [Paenibacillus maysiensis]|uniref:AraC family transcriptional regulator n=1 Tax=Paenibacillus maysiensis TaxID=1155954 RepID=UPI0004726E5D|nr:helix-turn-helix domain-containing protein [Paenibacillus maysiensis]